MRPFRHIGANIRRSREQCKFTCDCRGVNSICGRRPNCAEAESRANSFAMPRRNSINGATAANIRRSREQCKFTCYAEA